MPNPEGEPKFLSPSNALMEIRNLSRKLLDFNKSLLSDLQKASGSTGHDEFTESAKQYESRARAGFDDLRVEGHKLSQRIAPTDEENTKRMKDWLDRLDQIVLGFEGLPRISTPPKLDS